MKIEIDTNNLAALERLASDLDIALGSVRHAIDGLKAKGASRAPAPAPRQEEAPRAIRIPSRAAQAFSGALSGLGDEFTTRELMDAALAAHPHTGRLGILSALRASVDNGQLEQIQPGAGRRPARYRKINGT
jgi:hypothetical protein